MCVLLRRQVAHGEHGGAYHALRSAALLHERCRQQHEECDVTKESPEGQMADKGRAGWGSGVGWGLGAARGVLGA